MSGIDGEARPQDCRNRLRDEGKAYPRSGCLVCKDGGLRGCPYEGARPLPTPSSIVSVDAGELVARLKGLLAQEDLTFAECSLAEDWCLGLRDALAALQRLSAEVEALRTDCADLAFALDWYHGTETVMQVASALCGRDKIEPDALVAAGGKTFDKGWKLYATAARGLLARASLTHTGGAK
jgi:hypothetical protein